MQHFGNFSELLPIIFRKMQKVLDNPLTNVYTLYVDSYKGISNMKFHIDLEGHAFINGLMIGMLIGVSLTAILVVLVKSMT